MLIGKMGNVNLVLPKMNNKCYKRCTPDKDAEDLFPHFPSENSGLCDILFSESDLSKAIEELKPAAGPDDFPAKLLIMCRHSLARPLYTIWRHSLNTGQVPDLCKFTNIVPIHKGKSRAAAKNYRPVALTSLLIKTFEKVIRKHLVSFMEEHQMFNHSQHGFRCGRFCLSQLLARFDHITHLLEQGKSVDVIYLDFAKVFDEVDIGLILRKLKALGISPKLGRWLHGFLLRRTHCVIVNGKNSEAHPVESRVPQSPVLGPLLFLVLIGDIDEEVSSSFLSSFADDTRIAHEISSSQDMRQLQTDLEAVYRWSKNNNMEFNSDKFEHVHYKAKNSEEPIPKCNSNNGAPIETKSRGRDHGITMSSNASFTDHISERITALK